MWYFSLPPRGTFQYVENNTVEHPTRDCLVVPILFNPRLGVARLFLCLNLEFVMKNAQNCTIQEIAREYQEKLVGKTAIFEVKDPLSPIKVRFSEGHLAHLLALHYFDLKRGEELFPRLVEGEITWDDLKKRNIGNFEQHEYRMRNMIYLPEVIENGMIATYKGGIKADLMIYHPIEKRYLSLGIYKERTTEFFIPTTFIENKRNKFSKSKHLAITNRSII